MVELMVIQYLLFLRLIELVCLCAVLWWSIFHLEQSRFKTVQLAAGFLILGVNFWAIAIQIGYLRSQPW